MTSTIRKAVKVITPFAQQASPYLAAGGTGLDIFGQLLAGSDVDRQSSIEQSFAENQALQEGLRGADAVSIRAKQGERLESKQNAQFAKSNVRVNKGTPLLVIAETAMDTAHDVAAIKAGSKARAGAFRERGRTFRGIGKSRRRASRFGAGTSLLSGLSDLTRSIP